MQIAKGKVTDIIVIRLGRGEDMIGGIKEACKKNGIKHGVIISLVGSLDGAYYCCPVVNQNNKSGISNCDPMLLSSPATVLSAAGEICHDKNGEISIHMHATFVSSDGKAYGGHIEGEGNKVLNTLNVVIGIIEGVDMGFEWDEMLGEMKFCPKELQS